MSFLFPRPTGRYAVGTASYYLKDDKRYEIHVDPSLANSAKRELMIQVWYPAVGSEQPVPYSWEAVAQMLHIERSIDYSVLTVLQDVYSYAQPNIEPFKKSTYPVILFSPGFGCPRTNNTATCEELASHGYVVVGIDHTYASSLVRFPDGRVILYKGINIFDQDIDDCEQQVWVEDAQFVLNELERLNQTDPLLHDLCNLGAIGMFGHSYGGSTACQLCRVEKRCKAGISLDGGLFGKNPTVGFKKPFMFLLAGEGIKNPSDEELEKYAITRSQFINLRKKWDEFIPQLCAELGAYASQVVIKKTKHNAFSDAALLQSISVLKKFDLDVGDVDGCLIMAIINNYIVSFFEQHCKR